jgi:thiol:disulfide interchange protein
MLRLSSSTVVALTFLAGLLAPGALSAAEGPFHKIKFTAACTQAQSEGKFVFVDVWAAWCGPCKLLDQTTWTDAAVIDLLKARTVAIKINADSDPKFAGKYNVEALPTLLVLRPDGTEVTRVVGYVDAEKFRAQLESTLASAP